MIILFVLITLSSGEETSENRTIVTKSGTVVGKHFYFRNKTVESYLGIPYAQPPIGDLRFKKPLPIEPWNETLMADTMPPGCMQYTPYDYPYVDAKHGKSEDCLYLNIWTPANRTARKKSVMFWIHGGGFTYGSSRLDVYNGQVLAAKNNVIVVTTNYRLGVLGFFSSGTDDAPGNMGLYDILEALKWVKRNIEAFGGNRKSITIFGEGAGSTIGSYFTISPLTKGLFKRLIMQDGAPNLLDEKKDRNLELGQKLASAVGCTTDSQSLAQEPEAVVGCLRKKKAVLLVMMTNSFNPTNLTYFDVIFGDEFLPVSPREALTTGGFRNVSILAGYNKDVGSIDLIRLDLETFGPHGKNDPDINKTFGEDLIRKGFENFSNRDHVVDHYLGGLKENNYTAVRQQVYHSLGDFKKVCPTIYFGESFARKQNDVYFYYFQHVPLLTPWADWMGVPEFDEVPFIFGRPFDNALMYSDEERSLSKKMMKMWTNFAKLSRPNKKMKKSTENTRHYIVLKIEKHQPKYWKQHEKNCKYFKPFFGL